MVQFHMYRYTRRNLPEVDLGIHHNPVAGIRDRLPPHLPRYYHPPGNRDNRQKQQWYISFTAPKMDRVVHRLSKDKWRIAFCQVGIHPA